MWSAGLFDPITDPFGIVPVSITRSGMKSGRAMLKSFYFMTTQAYHERWPATPDNDILEEAGHNAGKVKEIAQEQLLSVSALAYATSAPSHLKP
jgi:hypothetical protein